MRKALIFVSAFVVSSMVIYMVYYYSQQHKLSRGIIATADELPQTKISPLKPKHFLDTSYMGSAGLLLADTSLPSTFAAPGKYNMVVVNASFSAGIINDVNEDISSKFPNHPPIGFPHIRDGEKILFSYFFENVMLPEGFNLTAKQINGQWYRCIFFNGKPKGIRYLKIANTQVVEIPVNSGKTRLVISNKPFEQDFLLKDLPEGETIDFPEVDFSIIKYWKPEEAAEFLPNAKNYKHLEQRIKLKISVPKEDLENFGQSEKEAGLNFSKPFYLYLFGPKEQQPYFMLYINNNELLLPLKQ